MKLDINKEPIPQVILSELQSRRHDYLKLTTIRSLLNYFLFTFGLRVYLSVSNSTISTNNEVYSIESEDFSTGNIVISETEIITTPSKRNLQTRTVVKEGDYNIELGLWTSGLKTSIIWISNYRDVSYKVKNYIDIITLVHTYVFGTFDRNRLELLKNALSSHSAKNYSKSATFKFEDIDNFNPVMAKHLIDYVEFMLGPAEVTQSTLIFAETAPNVSSGSPNQWRPYEEVVQENRYGQYVTGTDPHRMDNTENDQPTGSVGIIEQINSIIREEDRRYVPNTNPVENILNMNPHMREVFDEALRSHARAIYGDATTVEQRQNIANDIANEQTTNPTEE